MAANGMKNTTMCPPWARTTYFIPFPSYRGRRLGTAMLRPAGDRSQGRIGQTDPPPHELAVVALGDVLRLQRLLHLRRVLVPRPVLEHQEPGDGQLGLTLGKKVLVVEAAPGQVEDQRRRLAGLDGSRRGQLHCVL